MNRRPTVHGVILAVTALSVIAFTLNLLVVRPFTVRTGRGMFLHADTSPLQAGEPEPAIELLVSRDVYRMLLGHGDVMLMFSSCDHSRPDARIGFPWPSDEQSDREVAPGLYSVGFTVESFTTVNPAAMAAATRENVRCVYVAVPRVPLGPRYRSNTVMLPPAEHRTDIMVATPRR